MRFYNLTFDCNLPTKQQINIPTNTDYKVGIKVTKNGTEVSPLPKNVTLGGLSADTEKTNGYITFTKSAGDDPSYIVEKLNIDEGMEQGATELSALGLNTSGASISLQINPIAIDVPDALIGQTLANAADLSCLFKAQTTEAPIQEVWDANATSILDRLAGIGAYNYAIGKSTWKGQPVKVIIPNRKAYDDQSQGGYALLAGFAVGEAIMFQNEAGTAWVDVVDRKDFTFKEGDKLYVCSAGSWSNNRYGYCGIALQAGTPIAAKFDLATNVFKSQMGDKADLDESANTVEFAGEYTDGTTFHYDIITK